MKYHYDNCAKRALSVLGIGCMRFPKKGTAIDLQKTTELVRTAIDNGVNYFETAYIYPGSEEALGQALLDGYREKVYIADSLPLRYCRSSLDFDKLLKSQLERLKTDHIDYYMMDMLSDMDTWQRLCSMGIEKWLKRCKDEGKLVQAGFSYHGGREELLKLIDAYAWDFCQIQCSYMDENDQAGKADLTCAADKGIPVFVMEPLLGGKLADPPKNVRAAFEKANSDYSPAAWALRWVWNHKEATLLLSGVSTVEQLMENIKIADSSEPGMLTAQELALYEEARAEITRTLKIPCTGCGYCLPCPAGVDIPNCFAAYNSFYSVGKRAGRQNYIQGTGALTPAPHTASKCMGCRKCEIHCPQSIKIASEMNEVTRIMEPLWFRISSFFRRSLRGGE